MLAKIGEKSIQRELFSKFKDCDSNINKNNNIKNNNNYLSRGERRHHNRIDNHSGWLQLRREYKSYLHQTILIIFNSNFAPIKEGRNIEYVNYVNDGTKFRN